MEQAFFFESLQLHLEQELPFVVYRKPNSKVVKALLQEDAVVHYTKDFNEPGFVFAPFDNKEDAVLLFADECLECILNLDVNGSTNVFEDLEKNNSVNGLDKERHLALVNSALPLLENDDLQKVVLSRREKVVTDTKNPLEKFVNLSIHYSSAMVYCWYHPKVGLWLGATPETLLLISKEKVHTMALAGTQPYQGTMDVVWGEKELKEQQLVTDAIIDGLTPIVEKLTYSDTYTYKAGGLLHLRTDIKADIKTYSLHELVRTLHPTPAVCGLPMQRAKNFILDNEDYNRAFYTGFLGEIQLPSQENTELKETNLFVNLRCMQLVNNEVLLYVGGGITKASVPEKEWEETVRKTNTMKSVL